MFRKTLALAAVIGITIGLTTGTLQAEEYPSKAIKVIVPNGAGGSTDITSRLVAGEFTKHLGADLAIVNMGGGGTSIGAMEAANADADGYTMLSTHEAFLTSSALGVNTMGPASMTPVAQVAKEVIVLAVPKGSAITTLAEFYDAAKTGHSGKSLKLGINPGAANHFFLLSAMAPIEHDVTFVPTGGGAKTLKALLSGTIDGSAFAVSESIEAIRSGDVIPIALFDGERHADLPDTPTAAEEGHDVTVGLHYVWYAPKGTPDDRVAKLAEGLKATISDETFNNKLVSRSITPSYMSGTELEEAMAERYENIGALAKKYVIGE